MSRLDLILILVGAISVWIIAWCVCIRWAIKSVTARMEIQRRLLEHAQRMPPKSVKREATIMLRDALRGTSSYRYTKDHQADVHRCRAERREAAKIEAGEPKSTAGTSINYGPH